MQMFAISVLLFVAGSVLRVGYEILVARGKLQPQRRWLALVFVAMCALWMGWFNLCECDPLKWDPPAWARAIGAALTALGSLLVIGGAGQLLLCRANGELVTRGFFARLRHPMYTGFWLWFLGYPLHQGSWSGWLFGALGAAEVWLWYRLEEQQLLRRFGKAYLAYRAKTWC